MFHIDIVQTAIRDSKGRFTGQYDFDYQFLVNKNWSWSWDRGGSGLLKAQLFLCPLILWIAMEVAK